MLPNRDHCQWSRYAWCGMLLVLVLSCGCVSPDTSPVSSNTNTVSSEPAPVSSKPNRKAPHSAPVSKNTSPVSFYADVSPIFNEYCVRCHGVEEQEAQLELTTLSSVLSGGDSGPAIEPGKPDSSLLWELVSDKSMPPKGPRPSRAERALIRRWIATGARD